jgi:hypothetical protein
MQAFRLNKRFKDIKINYKNKLAELFDMIELVETLNVYKYELIDNIVREKKFKVTQLEKTQDNSSNNSNNIMNIIDEKFADFAKTQNSKLDTISET